MDESSFRTGEVLKGFSPSQGLRFGTL